MNPAATIAITAGEPAGIGPDLCIELARRRAPEDTVVIADRGLLQARARQRGVALALTDYRPGSDAPSAPGTLRVLHLPLARPAVPGQLDPDNSRYVLATLDRAIDGCSSGEFCAMVTAPVHKGVINDAGIAFTGHTEYLAARTGTPRVVMMLVGGGMRVALVTTHLPLRQVADAITGESLMETVRILQRDLRRYFGIAQPRILVAGLNPHAGEGGHLGREEIEVMAPALDRLRREGVRLAGPLPADTLFNPDILAGGDCVLAMYHDQGLPVLKHASFGSGVNVTLGLPIIRTSVDHGTALDRAGSGTVESGSLMAAIAMAREMVSCSAGTGR